MAKIAVEEDYAASAAVVWKRLADFGGLASWMPGVESCETEGDGIGAVRKVVMGPVQVVERLEAFDDAGRSLSYSIAEGPMPVENYLATIRVQEAGADACHVDWTASFDLPDGLSEEQLAPGLQGAYGGALKALKPLVEG
ncbi:MAG: SRPBCC family protein [Deltaproteobacteria bacterium]|nr:SRPBCC family protein [Deltaproteobacteria bacterium]MBW2361283.1 SRPBCC family protein [Deltaproteobacteria bacterium]